jgi:hypothetical protein
MMKFLMTLILYGGLALLREFLAISYYRAVIAKLAGTVSALNFAIEILDLFVLSLILASFLRFGNFIPAIVYAVFGSFGAYLGVKLRQ